MSVEFGQPDKPETEQPQVQEPTIEPKTEPQGTAPNASTDALAYDLSDFITQPRQGASTGERQKLEANQFNDEDLLNEAGYTKDGEPPVIDTEAEELEEDQPTEISEEWLEIFAWAGVELTDEAMPLLLAYLHAEDDHQRFKLPPERRDKLRMAWIAFLRKVLPPIDDKGGLLIVIIMLYIENLVLGVWKTIDRVMAGTFTWPNVWPFKRFNKKAETVEEEETAPPSPAPQPPISADEAALRPEPMQPAPTVRSEAKPLAFDLPKKKAEEAPKELPPAPAPEIHAPEPIQVSADKMQDPISQELFTKGTGHPKQDKFLESKKNGKHYRIKADTFKGQPTFQKWMHKSGYYKTNEELEKLGK